MPLTEFFNILLLCCPTNTFVVRLWNHERKSIESHALRQTQGERIQKTFQHNTIAVPTRKTRSCRCCRSDSPGSSSPCHRLLKQNRNTLLERLAIPHVLRRHCPAHDPASHRNRL